MVFESKNYENAIRRILDRQTELRLVSSKGYLMGKGSVYCQSEAEMQLVLSVCPQGYLYPSNRTGVRMLVIMYYSVGLAGLVKLMRELGVQSEVCEVMEEFEATKRRKFKWRKSQACRDLREQLRDKMAELSTAHQQRVESFLVSPQAREAAIRNRLYRLMNPVIGWKKRKKKAKNPVPERKVAQMELVIGPGEAYGYTELVLRTREMLTMGESTVKREIKESMERGEIIKIRSGIKVRYRRPFEVSEIAYLFEEREEDEGCVHEVTDVGQPTNPHERNLKPNFL
jgi:hypothetical protein